MSKKRDSSKITLGMIKGKPINTSVPSIAIRFHANAEEIEELYQSEDELLEKPEKAKTPTNVTDPESSPLRQYLPRLGKRSTSIDTSLTAQDSSPPSDRWKFLHEIKGKITKSVEDRITEIKHRSQEGDASVKKTKAKDKDYSSLSESEDMSESSISKTCGIVSTTEGVEMSSDDETPSLEKDKKETAKPKPEHKHRFRLIRKKKPVRESKVTVKTLANIYEISTGLPIKPSTSEDKTLGSEDSIEVESGVEALEDANLSVTSLSDEPGNKDLLKNIPTCTEEEVITGLVDQIVNLNFDADKVLSIRTVTGADIKQSPVPEESSKTFISPEGFIDLRPIYEEPTWMDFLYEHVIGVAVVAALYVWVTIPVYVNAFVSGILFTIFSFYVYNKFFSSSTFAEIAHNTSIQEVTEIPAVKEYQPIEKFEGWMNEYPDIYNPQTYHISQTQSVYIKLQGHLLRVSHTRAKIPKRAMWNESKHKMVFTYHRIYNLLGAKVTLLPDGLNKKRQWSKKYPICLLVNNDQIDFDPVITTEVPSDDEKKPSNGKTTTERHRGGFLRKKKVELQPQVFSKLNEEDFELESESSRASSPSPPEGMSPEISQQDVPEDRGPVDEEEEDDDLLKDAFDNEPLEDEFSLEDWGTFTPEQDSPTETHIYLFGRTGREKEDWFRRFVAATHKGYNIINDSKTSDLKQVSETLLHAAKLDSEYWKYMSRFQKLKLDEDQSVLWVNSLLGRVLFDCMRDEHFTDRVKERIQRKLNSIKLPYFIEQISISELNLGNTAPIIHKASKPVLDQRGLWVDLDVTYEGSVVLTLQTKLNLMKLKQPPTETVTDENPSAKWQSSDVEDTAESSTDDDTHFVIPGKILDEQGFPVTTGGPSNTSKKFIKIVDNLAASKFFQAATENKYIKKAMEGVSNTDLLLKVEIKNLVGTMVLNMPPPPSDRVWIGFRPMPKLWMATHPMVGDRSFSFLKQLTSWIERKLLLEFQKVLVIPNMEDILIPVMSSQLPQ